LDACQRSERVDPTRNRERREETPEKFGCPVPKRPQKPANNWKGFYQTDDCRGSIENKVDHRAHDLGNKSDYRKDHERDYSDNDPCEPAKPTCGVPPSILLALGLLHCEKRLNGFYYLLFN